MVQGEGVSRFNDGDFCITKSHLRMYDGQLLIDDGSTNE